ncbi:MAG: ABC transporter substrate-binding protein [Clostridiales bacterium]|nr:ABC transporter substrate-binding protein [Clostridiales bacterium]
MKKIIALILAVMMCASVFAACGGNDTQSGGNASQTGKESSGAPLVVGYQQFNQKFSPFFAESGYDQDVASMTQVGLLTTDRAGAIIYKAIEGETTTYNGTDYNYKGLADLEINQADGKTTYDIKMRDDVKFSDGVQLTADDVIFTYYVLLDEAYTGNSTLNSLDIVGYKNYKYNNTKAEDVEVSADEIAAAIADPSDEVKEAITKINSDLLTSEWDWCDANWESYKEDYGVNSTREFFIMCYGTADSYDDGLSDEDLLKAVIEEYGLDYAKLGEAYGADLSGDVEAAVEKILTNSKLAEMDGEECPYISGIEKVNQFEVKVTTYGYGASNVYQIGNTVAPMHYYGDESKYDYDAHKFGFDKGDLSTVEAKTTTPMGAGPYKFIKYENKIVYFEANEDYFLGAPKIKEVQFKETADADRIPGVQTGTIDLTDPSLSLDNAGQIGEINGNGELTGPVITTSLVDNLGYGYIGINADKVKVGKEANSDASKNLRKAIATVLAAYRDVAIDSYYGETAELINYPISNTSWAAPSKSDPDYQLCYSKDVDGNEIYTSEMTDEEKYQAALQAAIGYLKAAGYTYDDASGKFTAAPEGASLTYTATIGSGGSGDHPNFLVLTEASKLFEKVGFTFKVDDVEWSTLSNLVNTGDQEVWTMAWGSTIDPDMYQVYHSSNAGGGSNYYSIKDNELDQLIVAARTSDDQTYRKAVYKQCFDIILDWAVEIPVYQRKNCIIFSSERIDTDTITPDITPYYGWMAEIQNMIMK